jgi:hypothetical protein
MTHETLEGLGLHLDFDHIMQLLPGFPPGTIMRLEVGFENPPRVTSAAGEGAGLGIVIEGADIKMIGTLPDGSSRVLHIEMDMQAAAALAINPATNALEVALTGAQMTRVDMKEDAADMGFDVARLLQVLHETVLPTVVHEMGTMPVTGPVFSFADYAVILRDVSSNEAYVAAKVDLFRAPANDQNAPDTQILQAPAGAVNPHDAKVLVTGNDAEIPAELLQYAVTIDGVPAAAPTYVREIRLGEAGITKTYTVSVAAVDLAGNTDATPATADVLVDGISPSIVIEGDRIRNMPDTTSVELSWQATDDLTDPTRLRAQLRIHRLKDDTNALDTEEVAVIDVAPGQTAASFDVNPGNTYRAELHVIDEAGNDSSSSVLLKVGGAGCSVAGGGASGSLPIVFGIFMALAVLRRRN